MKWQKKGPLIKKVTEPFLNKCQSGLKKDLSKRKLQNPFYTNDKVA